MYINPPSSYTPAISNAPPQNILQNQEINSENKDIFSNLPPEILSIIFEFLSTPNAFNEHTVAQQPVMHPLVITSTLLKEFLVQQHIEQQNLFISQKLIVLMQLGKKFPPIINALLRISNTHAQSSWIGAQMKQSSRRIHEAVSNSNALKSAYIRDNIHNALKNMQHIEFRFSDESYDKSTLKKLLIILDVIAERRNVQSLDICICRAFRNIPSALIFMLKKILQQNLALSKMTLLLEKNRITDLHISKLAPHLNKNISRFTLEDNKIGDMGVKYLSPHLKNMSLFELTLRGADITNEGFFNLARSLPDTLEKLDLSVNHISGAAYIEPLEKLPIHLKYLHLDENEIGDEGLEHFVNSLPKGLEKLSLSENHISSAGLQYIIEILKNGLKKLYLHQNTICDEGASRMRDVLPETSIEEMILSFDLENKYQAFNKNRKMVEF